MRRRFSYVIWVGLAALLVVGAFAADEEDERTANQIQELVRYSHSLQNATLRGKLDFKGGENVPFSLVLKDGVVAFFFAEPKETVVLRQSEDSYQLSRQTEAGNVAVAKSEYGDKVRGTDVLYEDLTMRFLYWPWATKDGEESIRTRKCWKLHIRNPKEEGPYSQVWIWVDKKSGGLMKMVAFDWKGYQVKKFEVLSGQKIDGSWVLRDMNVLSYAPR
ncbi:MAG: outer membrane lipoprotein-sorting protein, partial [Verrucomicrobiales bacterium]|nr:outer membrane lipoprotein-sorting protein [Verrucomicrobiales bacterium]